MARRNGPQVAPTLLLAALAGCGDDQTAAIDAAIPPDLSVVFGDPADLAGGRKPRDFGNRDASCASVTVVVSTPQVPVDFILVVDNSVTMVDEMWAVQAAITDSFGARLAASGLDARVIVVSKHGDGAMQRICIGPPLSMQQCDPPDLAPMNRPPVYFAYDFQIEHVYIFNSLLETYAKPDVWGAAPRGWGGYLRPGVHKEFIVFSDENTNMTAADFDTALLALDKAQFGTENQRAYVWNSVIGMSGNAPAEKPWAPNDPVLRDTCGQTVINYGLHHQQLSILTGGLRAPLCVPGNLGRTFEEILQRVPASEIACVIPLPQAPQGRAIDPTTVSVQYLSSLGAPPEDLDLAPSSMWCAANAYLVEDGAVELCPATCARLRRDPKATLRVFADCP